MLRAGIVITSVASQQYVCIKNVWILENFTWDKLVNKKDSRASPILLDIRMSNWGISMIHVVLQTARDSYNSPWARLAVYYYTSASEEAFLNQASSLTYQGHLN